MPKFPLNARVRSKAEVAIFDANGYSATFGTFGSPIELPGDMLDLGLKIANFANMAYEQGREDQAQAIREAINYGHNQ